MANLEQNLILSGLSEGIYYGAVGHAALPSKPGVQRATTPELAEDIAAVTMEALFHEEGGFIYEFNDKSEFVPEGEMPSYPLFRQRKQDSEKGIATVGHIRISPETFERPTRRTTHTQRQERGNALEAFADAMTDHFSPPDRFMTGINSIEQQKAVRHVIKSFVIKIIAEFRDARFAIEQAQAKGKNMTEIQDTVDFYNSLIALIPLAQSVYHKKAVENRQIAIREQGWTEEYLRRTEADADETES